MLGLYGSISAILKQKRSVDQPPLGDLDKAEQSWHDIKRKPVYGRGIMKTSHPYSEAVRPILDKMLQAVLDSAQYLDRANLEKSALSVQVKPDNTLVMNLDLESQRRILPYLQGEYPIVAEEDPISHALISSEDSYFLVDPLDGTTSCKRFWGQQGGQVGFGPLVGFIKNHQLLASVFYSVPHRKLFTAVRGEGAHVTVFSADWTITEHYRPLKVLPCQDLSKAGVVFLMSAGRETRIVEHLYLQNAVENVYRFGGCASDCARLAQGYEQIMVSFSVKPWDFPAVLLAAEAGCEVYCDPLARRLLLGEWRLEANNPIIIIPAGMRDIFFPIIDAA
jgi:fructose-1,6-bisphosphatase/inositol monophosphatase family enzyme